MTDPISLDEFAAWARDGCETSWCNHDHGVMQLRSRCHPKAGASVAVDPESLVMRIACQQCDRDIVLLDLSEEEPDESLDTPSESLLAKDSPLTAARRVVLYRDGRTWDVDVETISPSYETDRARLWLMHHSVMLDRGVSFQTLIWDDLSPPTGDDLKMIRGIFGGVVASAVAKKCPPRGAA